MDEYRVIGITAEPDPTTNQKVETVLRTFDNPQLAQHYIEHCELDGGRARADYDRYVIQRRDVSKWVKH